MSFYIPLLANKGFDIVMLKATSSPTTDGNWSEQDGSVRVETGGKVKSLWSYPQYQNIAEGFDGTGASSNVGSLLREKQAFTFTPSATVTLRSVIFEQVQDNGSPTDDVKISVQTDSSGDPSGTELDSVTVADADWPSSSAIFGVRFAGEVTLTASTAYWIVIERTGSLNASNFRKLSSNSSGTLVSKYFDDGSWFTTSFELSARVMAEEIDDIYVATQQENGRVRLHIFDPSTDTWTTKNEIVADIGDHADFDSVAVLHGCSSGVRSDGDIVVVFTGHDDTSDDDDLFCISKTTVWGSVQLVANDRENPVAIGPDSSDRITFVYNDAAAAAVETRSINSSDVLQTAVSIESSADITDSTVGPGVIDSGNEIYVPYIDNSNQISVAQFTSADSPAGDITTHADVGDNTVKGQGASAIPFVVACLAVDGTDVHLLYADDTDADIQHDSDVDGGGTTDVELVAGTANRISCAVLGTNLDYVWLDGTTIKYGSLSLGDPPEPPATVPFIPISAYIKANQFIQFGFTP